MVVRIDGEAHLTGLSESEAANVVAALTIPNPEREQARRIGRPYFFMPENLCYATRSGDTLTVPRNALPSLWQYLNTQECTIIDDQVSFPRIEFPAKPYEPRDYQDRVHRLLMLAGGGVVEAPCGSGKTNIGLKAAAGFGQPTLWVTHTKDLLDQSLARAQQLFYLMPNDIGVIAEGRISTGWLFTFATVQTLAGAADEKIEALSRLFGTLVVDECHHVYQDTKTLSMFAKVISRFPARHKVGVSATVTRTDGLEITMYWLLGEVVAKVPLDVLKDRGLVIVPRVIRIDTQYEYTQPEGDMFNINVMLQDLTENEYRNGLLIEELLQTPEDSHIIGLSHRVEHVEALCRTMQRLAPERNPMMIHGGMKKKDRQAALAAAKAGDCRLLFATYGLAKEGLDLPILDGLALLTPCPNHNTITQSVGRVMRGCEGKSPFVLDFTDRHIKQCQGHWRSRLKVYKQLGCEIEFKGAAK
jgi:superfamily II DNA or RNA helicase